MTLQISTNTPTHEIMVDSLTGEAFISQRKAAEKLGVARDSLKSYLERSVCTQQNGEKLEISQGLSSEIFAICTQYYALDARNPTAEAKELLRMISQAGAKAYLYHEAGIPLGVSTQRASVDVDQRKLELYEPVLQQEVAAYKIRIEAAHKIAMEDIAQRRIALEQREYVLIDGMKVKIDMEASKVALPVVTITSIVAGSGIKPHDANMALLALGYLESNPNKGDRFMVSREGSYYGRNVKTSKDANVINARWFEGTAKELLEKIKEFFEAAD